MCGGVSRSQRILRNFVIESYKFGLYLNHGEENN